MDSCAVKMPAVFIGHGNPMNAIQENQYVENWRKVKDELPEQPKLVLCISAHWTTRKKTFITAQDSPRTIHDFGGFPRALFDVIYPAKGDPDFAHKLAQKEFKILGKKARIEENDTWGYDHGCWSVLKNIFPEADIPVVQLSLNIDKNAKYHYELGKELGYLRDEGVLVVGSGNIIHNLSLFDRRNITPFHFDWAKEADKFVHDQITTNNHDGLINESSWKSGGPMSLSVNSREHYLPFVYILGMQRPGETVRIFNDDCLAGCLSMTSFVIS